MGEITIKGETCTLVNRVNFFSSKLTNYNSFDDFLDDLQTRSHSCSFLERENMIRDLMIWNVVEHGHDGFVSILNDSLTFGDVASLCRQYVEYEKKNECFETFPGKIESDFVEVGFDNTVSGMDGRCEDGDVKRIEKNEGKAVKKEKVKIPRAKSSKNPLKKSNIKREPDDVPTSPNKTRPPGDIMCPLCKKHYRNITSVERHIQRTHQKIQCGRCAAEFTDKAGLYQHKPIHTQPTKVECTICHEKLTAGVYFRRHMTWHASLNPLNRSHGKIHSSAVHLCNVCGKSFGFTHLLKKHLQRHGTEKTFACAQCPKRFTLKHGLYVHQQTHSEPTYKCRLCEKRFKHKAARYAHEQKHQGIQPYSCNFCDKKFSCWSSRRYHVNLHTGERPYQCKRCDKAFAQPNGLKSHEKTHAK